jgi:hypothetical protein
MSANATLAATLADEARAAVLDETDFDEHVYDRCNDRGATAYNNGEGEQGSDDADYDQLHDSADASASEINNGGLYSQMLFLLNELGEPSVRQILDDAKATV